MSWGLFKYGAASADFTSVFEDPAGVECQGSYEDGFTHGWLHTWAAVCSGKLRVLMSIVSLST